MAAIPTLEATQPIAATQHVVVLQALLAAPARLAEAALALTSAGCAWHPTAEAWSFHGLVTHLAAAEALFLARLQRLLVETSPWLPYFGPDVAEPTPGGDLAEHLERFRTEREALVKFLCTMAPEDWERPGVHETMGPTTFLLQVHNIANHDAEHLQQIDALRQAWEQRAHD